MTTVLLKPTIFALRAFHEAATESSDGGHLKLRATEDGWSLLTAAGDIVFRGLGTISRRRCLEVARERGAIVVLS